MKLYRSICEDELELLLNECTVYGKYNCANERQNSHSLKNCCCFYVDDFLWLDSNHKYMIVADIPNDELFFGHGEYHAAKSLKDTRIWSGRSGSQTYVIREACTTSYHISDVKEIFLFGHFTDTYVNERIKPVCDAYGVKLYHMRTDPFEKSKQEFVMQDDKYMTKEATVDWITPLEVNEVCYINRVKEMLQGKEITLEQAQQIKKILRK